MICTQSASYPQQQAMISPLGSIHSSAAAAFCSWQWIVRVPFHTQPATTIISQLRTPI